MSNNLNFNCQYNVDQSSPAVTIFISGELNANTAPLFEQEVKNIFSKQPQNILIDLSNVTTFVSAAIGAILISYDYVTRKNFKFKIIAVNDKVKSILTITGLDYIMEL